MKRLSAFLVALCCMALIVPLSASAAGDRYIVVLDDGADAASVAANSTSRPDTSTGTRSTASRPG